jgi:hypothetical protein
VQRRRARARRANDAVAKVRRSQRLAAKQYANFVSMHKQAVNRKAARPLQPLGGLLLFLLARRSTPRALTLASDVQAMTNVAMECGASAHELADLTAPMVLPGDP